MKTLAVVPPVQIESVDVRPPMRLAYVASVLQRDNFKVDILDAHALQLSEDETLQEIAKRDPDLVLFDFYDFCTKQDFTNLISKVKRLVGCVIASNWPVQGTLGQAAAEEILQKTDLDIIVRGEPELTVLEMVKRLEKKQDVKRVRGISLKEDGRILHNSVRPMITDLDGLPFPARHLLPNHKYRMILMKDRPFTFMIGSRGCPYNCIFCKIPVTQGRQYRCRSPANIADELEWTVERNRIREVHFEDPIFALDKRRCKRICDEIASRRIDLAWSCHSRVDTVNRETLQAMKDAGCYQIHFGVESGDATVLRNIRKDIKIGQVKNAFRIAKSCGLETFAFFMIGNLGETKQSIEKTIRLCKELQPDFASFPVTIPIFGTIFYDILKRERNRTYRMSNEDILEESWKTYKRFYVSRSFVQKTLLKVIRQPSRLRSLAELFMGYIRLQRSKSARARSWKNTMKKTLQTQKHNNFST